MHLKFEKKGVIAGGYADLSYSKDDLTFRYSGEAKIDVGIATKKQKFGGSDIVPLESMLSKNCKIGAVVVIKHHEFRCISVNAYSAVLEINEPDAKGLIDVQTDEEIIKIVGFNITASYSGLKGKVIAHI